MHITLVTEHNLHDRDGLSGTLYQMAKELQRTDGLQVRHIQVSLPHKLLPPLEELAFRFKQFWLRLFKGTHYSSELYERRARYSAGILSKSLVNLKTDVILTALTPQTAAYLNTKIPIVFWTDNVYASLLGFYPSHRFHDPETMWDGHMITNACLMNAKLLIFSSQWAARSAIELYGISKNKVEVVPFGSNIDISHSELDVKNIIQARSRDCIKLLFVGKFWHRKGGDIALRITNALHAAGQPVELTIVGCTPPKDDPLPPYVKSIEFYSKNSKDELESLKLLYTETHLLLVPSRAECCANVFAEANAFGVPCITTYVGGITEAIKDGINGMAFSLEVTEKEVCDYIINLMSNYDQYELMALSSYNEYKTRLNWQTAMLQVKKLITDII